MVRGDSGGTSNHNIVVEVVLAAAVTVVVTQVLVEVDAQVGGRVL